MRSATNLEVTRVHLVRMDVHLFILATLVRSIFAKGDKAAVLEEFERVLKQLTATFPRVA